MNKVAFTTLVFLTLLSSSVFAIDDNIVFTTTPSTTACLDNQTAMWSWTYTNVSNTSQWYVISKSFTCNNNCSSTLANCRYTSDVQFYYIMIIMVAVFAIGAFGLWIGRITETMFDFPIYAILMIFLAFMGGYYDVFLPEFQTTLLAFFLIPVGFFLASLYHKINMRKETEVDDRAAGR